MAYLWKPHRFGAVQGREVLCPPDYDPHKRRTGDPILSIAAVSPGSRGRWVAMSRGLIRVFDDKDEAKVWIAAVAIIEGRGAQ